MGRSGDTSAWLGHRAGRRSMVTIPILAVFLAGSVGVLRAADQAAAGRSPAEQLRLLHEHTLRENDRRPSRSPAELLRLLHEHTLRENHGT